MIVDDASVVDASRVVVRRLGRTDYVTTWRAMQAFTDARSAHTADEIWLTEHRPVYTLGLAGRREHLLRANDIAVVKVDRGGQITFHGPGQAVLYTLVDLKRPRIGVRDFVRSLERAVINWLGARGVAAYGKPSAPGVYVTHKGAESKIAALGLKVRNGCTYHGIAINVAMDLAPFRDIDPCGYPGLVVTQLRDLGIDVGVDEVGGEVARMIESTITGSST